MTELMTTNLDLDHSIFASNQTDLSWLEDRIIAMYEKQKTDTLNSHLQSFYGIDPANAKEPIVDTCQANQDESSDPEINSYEDKTKEELLEILEDRDLYIADLELEYSELEKDLKNKEEEVKNREQKAESVDNAMRVISDRFRIHEQDVYRLLDQMAKNQRSTVSNSLEYDDNNRYNYYNKKIYRNKIIHPYPFLKIGV